MFLNTSLRTQILSLLGGSLLLVLLIALACFQFLSGGIHAYQGLLDGPVRSAQLIDRANLAFKNQVQEWKDVLLRGQMPNDMQKYWGLFEEQERNVQDILQQLQQNSSADPELQRQVSQLREEHRQLGAAYRNSPPVANRAPATPRSRASTAMPARK